MDKLNLLGQWNKKNTIFLLITIILMGIIYLFGKDKFIFLLNMFVLCLFVYATYVLVRNGMALIKEIKQGNIGMYRGPLSFAIIYLLIYVLVFFFPGDMFASSMNAILHLF